VDPALAAPGIFIDELDALGKARGVFTLAGGHDEREEALNQLLSEQDGFAPGVGVVLLAATNRPEVLDPALLRAGRFDRQVLVDRPDRPGRLAHALVALSLPGADRVHKVSIIPRGMGALGYTLQRPSQDRHVQRKGELLDRMTVLMAGRAAELVVFGEASTGAADDLVKATDLARNMVLRYGMDEGLGPVSWAGDRPLFLPVGTPASAAVGTAAATAQRADDAVHQMVNSALDRATHWLQTHRQTLDLATERLLQRETLGEEELLVLAGSAAALQPPPVSAR
jgi:ATP-dependent Zn protease